MFDEEDRETGFALFLVIALAITVSIFTLGIAAGAAISQAGSKATAAKSAASEEPAKQHALAVRERVEVTPQ